MAVTATVQPYVSQPVSAFTTHKTISLEVDGAAGTVPVSLGVGNSTQFQDISASVLANAVILAPATVDRNLIQPTANGVKGLSVKAKSGGGQYIFDCLDSSGNQLFWVAPDSVDSIVGIGAQANSTTLSVASGDGSGGNTSSIVQIFSINGAGGGDYDLFRIPAPSMPLVWNLEDSGSLHPETCRIVAEWASNTSGTTKGRLKLTATDSGAVREGFRVEGTGAAAAIGFLGGNAVVQQTGASAAGIAAITDANAKAAITAIQNALAAFNLVTSPA